MLGGVSPLSLRERAREREVFALPIKKNQFNKSSSSYALDNFGHTLPHQIQSVSYW